MSDGSFFVWTFKDVFGLGVLAAIFLYIVVMLVKIFVQDKWQKLRAWFSRVTTARGAANDD